MSDSAAGKVAKLSLELAQVRAEVERLQTQANELANALAGYADHSVWGLYPGPGYLPKMHLVYQGDEIDGWVKAEEALEAWLGMEKAR